MNKKKIIIICSALVAACLTLIILLNRNRGPSTPDALTSGVPSLLVQGTFIDKNGESLALINGKMVAEGDDVNGVKILWITKDSVDFEYEGKVFRQRISKGGGDVSEEETLEQYKARVKKNLEILERAQEQRKIQITQQAAAKKHKKETSLQVKQKQYKQYLGYVEYNYDKSMSFKRSKKYEQAAYYLKKSNDYLGKAIEVATNDSDRNYLSSLLSDREKSLKEIQELIPDRWGR